MDREDEIPSSRSGEILVTQVPHLIPGRLDKQLRQQSNDDHIL